MDTYSKIYVIFKLLELLNVVPSHDLDVLFTSPTMEWLCLGLSERKSRTTDLGTQEHHVQPRGHDMSLEPREQFSFP